MIHSHWPTGDYPILVNPTMDEYHLISDHKWDTLRIVIDGDDIGIASGFGNTHTSVSEAMRKILGRKIFGENHIIWRTDDRIWVNVLCQGDYDKEPSDRFLKHDVSTEHENILRDIIQMTGFSLT